MRRPSTVQHGLSTYQGRRPAALLSSYTSGCRMRPHHGLLAWSNRRARSSLQLKSWLKRLSLVPGSSCARFLRILGPAGTPHPLCHGSASARMLSARRRHLSRRWRNVGPSSPLDESESESSQKLLISGKTRRAKRLRSKRSVQNVWYECKLQNSPFLGCTSAKRSGAKR